MKSQDLSTYPFGARKTSYKSKMCGENKLLRSGWCGEFGIRAYLGTIFCAILKILCSHLRRSQTLNSNFVWHAHLKWSALEGQPRRTGSRSCCDTSLWFCAYRWGEFKIFRSRFWRPLSNYKLFGSERARKTVTFLGKFCRIGFLFCFATFTVQFGSFGYSLVTSVGTIRLWER